jgi:hypothetical protein
VVPRTQVARRRLLRGSVLGVAGVGAAWLAACGGGRNEQKGGSSGQAVQAGSATTTGNLNATLRSGIASDVGSMDPQSLAGTGGGNWPNYTTN